MKFEQFETMKDLYEHLKNNGIVANYKEAERWAYENVPKEKYFQARILEYLRDLIKSGAIQGHVWKDQAGPYQSGGIPDVNIVTGGKYFGFEVKRPFLGKPSALQIKTAKDLQSGGGVVEFVSYVSEVEKILREHNVLKGGGASGN